MKKFVAILLSVLMVMALFTTALADDTVVQITGGSTFDAYKLFNLTVSFKGGIHHGENGCTADANDADAEGHLDSCYNYSYTVNADYKSILQDYVLKNASTDHWDGNVPSSASDVSEEKIKEYLEGLNAESTRRFADTVYRAIKDANLTADKPGITDTAEVEQGYWLFADVTDLKGDVNAANSLVMLDTKGQHEVTVTPKLAIPEVSKKVKDIADSDDSNITDNAWQDSADYDIGDTIPFKLTGTIASNYKAYQKWDENKSDYVQYYTLKFHDDMSDGLTFKAGSVKVYKYDTKALADADAVMHDGVEISDALYEVKTGCDCGCDFYVVIDNVFATGTLNENNVFVVTYEAELNENAVIGAEGNPNTVKLEYSNNAYDETSTGVTPEDKVKVFTYQLNINKVDGDGHALAGAAFQLFKKNAAGDYEAVGEILYKDADDNELTIFEWEGLDDGTYKLVETEIPAGYNGIDPIEFTISAAHDTNSTDPKLTELKGGKMGNGVVETGVIENNVVNLTGTVLPETGARGTVMLIGNSSMVVMLAAVFMITRKKMSVYED